MRKIADIVIVTVVVLLTSLIVYLLVVAVVVANVEYQCAENEYPGAKVTWNLKGYCMREIDETEYIIPLEDVK